jgi:hypothetical protein
MSWHCFKKTKVHDILQHNNDFSSMKHTCRILVGQNEIQN